MDKGNAVDIIFSIIKFSSAFDTVPHDILIKNLIINALEDSVLDRNELSCLEHWSISYTINSSKDQREYLE